MSERVHDPKFSKPKQLLEHVPGIEFVDFERPDECCGFGGSFSVTEEAVAAQMGYDKVEFMRKAGAIVTVTNEGNADLSGNVPELRICSVGLEKIIPRNEDLAVFIRLLTRSATGNSITQYTSHFRAARQNGEMHIILVDNGRSSRLGMEKFWPSLKCIRCAACMNTCPVYRRSGGLSYGSTYMGPSESS